MPSLLIPRLSEQTALFGTLDLSSYADLFLQGVLCAQFAHYMNANEHDSAWMKLFVAGLALLTTVKSVQILAIEWMQNADLFESLEALSKLWFAQWISRLTLPLEAIIAFYVQMFFCHRLWVLSHNKHIVVTAIILFVLALAAACVATYFFPDEYLSAVWVSVHLGFAVGGDIIQTGGIVFYLLHHSKTLIRRGPTASMISSLLWLTIQSAAPGALCELSNFSTTVSTLPAHAVAANKLSPGLAAAAFTNLVLSKIYAVSAMWTLNSREEIRTAAANVPPTHLDLPTSGLVWADEGNTGDFQRSQSEAKNTQTTPPETGDI
ncbi:hypothetical protein MSAN_02354800 [Mycena sanguinolenta]|uniref:DUF6534 domain-containing protein n=1 Tax=Mycena sanguinolenta TaxID=230812 RepID=A0A8H7CFB7_9AGAR|nr:hypothetical protein MSAN_02354800 [Mycena sanguinolenta]